VQYFLEQCLLSVQASCKNIVAEIIVVDNNSTDKSCKIIKDKFPKVSLIENKINVGFAKANNQGVNKAKGIYVLILNPDTVLAEDTIDQVLNFAKHQQKMGAIGVRFIDGTGNFLPECKRNVPTLRIANQKIRGNSKNYYATQFKENEITKVDILTGAFMLLKRDVYLENGGFDEDYFMFGEDIDFSYKLINKGFLNYYFGESSIIHYKGESTIKDYIYLKNFYGSMQTFYKKHYKVNILSVWFSAILVKMMVVFKSLVKHDKIQKSTEPVSLLYLGEDIVKYKKIKSKLSPVNSIKSKELLINIKNFNLIIFDNSFFTFKEIIGEIYALRNSNISVRIIPKNCNFLIGSDTSVGRGEVIEF